MTVAIPIGRRNRTIVKRERERERERSDNIFLHKDKDLSTSRICLQICH